MNKIFFGATAVLIAAAGLLYWNWSLNRETPPQDPIAITAIQMVKSHQSRKAPTIEQAINQLVTEMEKRGKPVRMGEWRAAPDKGDIYMVSLIIREKGPVGWVEREYAWRVNVKEDWIRVVSLPAIHLMPFHELPPLPHSDQISGVRPHRIAESTHG